MKQCINCKLPLSNSDFFEGEKICKYCQNKKIGDMKLTLCQTDIFSPYVYILQKLSIIW